MNKQINHRNVDITTVLYKCQPLVCVSACGLCCHRKCSANGLPRCNTNSTVNRKRASFLVSKYLISRNFFIKPSAKHHLTNLYILSPKSNFVTDHIRTIAAVEKLKLYSMSKSSCANFPPCIGRHCIVFYSV